MVDWKTEKMVNDAWVYLRHPNSSYVHTVETALRPGVPMKHSGWRAGIQKIKTPDV